MMTCLFHYWDKYPTTSYKWKA